MQDNTELLDEHATGNYKLPCPPLLRLLSGCGAGFLLLECLDREMNGKTKEMEKVVQG